MCRSSRCNEQSLYSCIHLPSHGVRNPSIVEMQLSNKFKIRSCLLDVRDYKPTLALIFLTAIVYIFAFLDLKQSSPVLIFYLNRKILEGSVEVFISQF